MNRSLTNEEVDAIQMKVREELVKTLHVELR
jgi:phenylalanyl-tRNA synthetase beta subunit